LLRRFARGGGIRGRVNKNSGGRHLIAPETPRKKGGGAGALLCVSTGTLTEGETSPRIERSQRRGKGAVDSVF